MDFRYIIYGLDNVPYIRSNQFPLQVTILCLVFALALAVPQDPRGKTVDAPNDTRFDEDFSIEEDGDFSIEEDEDFSIEEDELEDEDYSIEEDDLEDEDYSIEEDDLEDELDKDDFLVEGDRMENFDMPEFGVPDEDGNYRVDDMMMTEEQFRSMFGPED